jgi:cytochrome oxidase assembly protein ShyY1
MLLRPRYVALSLLMLIIAIVCVALGTWQISRLQGKIGANDELRANAHAQPAAVGDVLPLVGAPGGSPPAHRVQYREIKLTGSYDAGAEALVRQRTVDVSNGDDDPSSDTGYWVLTPFDTPQGSVLVVRGFISGSSGSGATPTVPTPPAGQVTITARVQPAETRTDDAAKLPDRQVESINPVEQAQRLGRPVYNGYAELLAGQPGIGSLFAIPAPSLSNPAGGAVEPQHVAYIIQWYLFAALALAAPFAMIRAETKHQDNSQFGDPEPADNEPANPEPVDSGLTGTELVDPRPSGQPQATPEQTRAAKLADRYGRAFR